MLMQTIGVNTALHVFTPQKDIIDLQLSYSERVTLAMTLENGFQTHSQASTLTLTSYVSESFNTFHMRRELLACCDVEIVLLLKDHEI